MDERLSKIAFVIIWFGNFREDMELWLLSCAANPTIDWLIFTDNKEKIDFPSNVHKYSVSFEEVQERFQKLFDFPISLNRVRRLCDFKVAYGEAFAEELSGYDFWGYCDTDMLFGDIRSFLSEKVLSDYEKIGFVGNCTLYRNTPENSRRYREKNHRGEELYRKYFSSEGLYCFDEVGINDIYLTLGIKIYREINFSDLASNCYAMKQCFLPSEKRYQNQHVIYLWDRGSLYHVFVHRGRVERKEVMFVHFLSVGGRRFHMEIPKGCDRFLITPDRMIPYEELTVRCVKKYARPKWICYILRQLSKQKSPMKMCRWIWKFMEYHYWLQFHSGVYNYWTWTRYEKDKKDRIYLLAEH